MTEYETFIHEAAMTVVNIEDTLNRSFTDAEREYISKTVNRGADPKEACEAVIGWRDILKKVSAKHRTVDDCRG